MFNVLYISELGICGFMKDDIQEKEVLLNPKTASAQRHSI